MSRLFFYRHIEVKSDDLELVSQTNSNDVVVVQ